MISIPNRATLLFALLAVAAGCAGRGPRIPPVEPGAEGGAALATRLGGRPCPRDLASDVEVTIQPLGRPAVRLVGGMRAAWPASVRIQLRFGPFTPVASIAVDGDSAYVSLPRMKAFWAGGSVGEGSNPAVLASSLLWLICPAPLVRSMREPVLDRDRRGWALRGRVGHANPPLTLSLRLDEDQSRIEEIIFADSIGRTVLKAERSGKTAIKAVDIPDRIRLETGDPPILFEARLMRPHADKNQAPGLFRILPPSGARLLDEEDLLELVYSGGEPR